METMSHQIVSGLHNQRILGRGLKKDGQGVVKYGSKGHH